VVIVAPDHRLARVEAVTLDDLSAETILGGEPGTGTGTLLRSALGRDAARLRTAGGFGSTEAVKHAVRAGLGVSIVLAATVADEVAAGSLVAREIAGAELAKDIHLVLPHPLPDTSPAARFAAYVLGTAGAVRGLPGHSGTSPPDGTVIR
jgi:DNA-binding transcriptional LysR family regulator